MLHDRARPATACDSELCACARIVIKTPPALWVQKHLDCIQKFDKWMLHGMPAVTGGFSPRSFGGLSGVGFTTCKTPFA
jgi:hypothetical protein